MIFLSHVDILFMLTTLQLKSDLRQVLETIADKDADIDEYTTDELRDCCTDRLDEIGFDENYELTEAGAKLEALVDKLFVG